MNDNHPIRKTKTEMKPSRLLLATALVIAGLLALAATAFAAPGIDPSYGQNGVAYLSPVAPPGYQEPKVEDFASARDGSVYLLVVAGTSDSSCKLGCVGYFLERVGPTGASDPTFAGGAPVALPPVAGGYQIVADARGRVIASGGGGGSLDLYRYDLAGNLDSSFGTAGTATVTCHCEPRTVHVMPAGRERILVEGATGESLRKLGEGRVSLTRLLPDGTPDPGFGRGGSIRYPLHKALQPNQVAVARRGAILLESQSCCAADAASVVRVSAEGKIDTRFDRTALGSLRILNTLSEDHFVTALVVRNNGTMDLLGINPGRALGGFDLRLLANGRLDRTLGSKGLVKVTPPIETATLGPDGAVFVASRNRFLETALLFKILPDGRFDAGFGGEEGLAAEAGGREIQIGVQDRGRVVLMDQGIHETRFPTPSTPAITRFRVGTGR